MKNKMDRKNKDKITTISKLLIMTIIVGGVILMQSSSVLAADDPLSVINNLSTFMFSIIRAVGMILLGWGIVQIGLALKSHDPSQRANRFSNFSRWSNYNICKRDIGLNNWRIKKDRNYSCPFLGEGGEKIVR